MSGTERAGMSPRTLKFLAWAVLLGGLWVWGRTHGGADASANAANGSVRELEGPAPKAVKPLKGSAPVSLSVPGTRIEAPVVERGLDDTGAVDAPPFSSPEEVGWFKDGARPGAAGVATFVGHLDTATKPAVFYRLADVRPGEQVRIARADGTTAVFTVNRVETMEKSSFDARRVYGQQVKGRAELRLITCGGRYEPTRKTYSANLVVSGYLTGSR
ncbi:class F sortase [Streptomyces sp. NPDC051940]|uniref:class F sortase n=1 Tax=Streptomyces sp. NPDC051940 TaxID=3155675 RepID=UPI00344658DF